MNLDNVIENEIEYEIYNEKILEITNYLTVFGPKKFWEIEKNVGASERRTIRLLNEMVKEGIICFNKETFCFYVKGEENAKHKDYLCTQCQGRRVELDEIQKLKSILKSIWENKPKPTLLFDQRPVTMNTSLRRVAYLLTKNDVYSKKIVFLGDDDLTSICLAFAMKDVEITVLDADERLIEYINEISKKYKLNITAKIYNVMEQLDEELIGKFDVLMTDPTPESIPFTVFTNSAIDLLNENGIMYTSIYSTAMAKSMNLQRIITDMNLYITEMIPNFTEYQAIDELYSDSDRELFKNYGVKFNEDSICFTETLFRLLKNKDTHKIKIEYTSKDMMGKATKRVLKDNTKEIAKETEYLNSVREKLVKNENKRMIDGE